jgi:integrase
MSQRTPAAGEPRKPRSLPIAAWPKSDQSAWAEACRFSVRLWRGGSASHLAAVSQRDIANRYGLFLDYLDRHNRLDPSLGVTQLVTPEYVDGFLDELEARVRSVTVWNSIYKLRRAAELIVPASDFSWLKEIEKDVAAVMQPRDKTERLVLTERLVEAGLTLIEEAEAFGKTPVGRARGVRNGLMIALLGPHPLRIRNFATLRIGQTIKRVEGRWWLIISVRQTKTHRLDERRISDFMTKIIDRYVEVHRPALSGNESESAFWISSTTRKQITVKNMGSLISKITLQTIGVDVSPHLFRTAAATTASVYGTRTPGLASGVLGHRDQRIADDHYIKASSHHAGNVLADIIAGYRNSA